MEMNLRELGLSEMCAVSGANGISIGGAGGLGTIARFGLGMLAEGLFGAFVQQRMETLSWSTANFGVVGPGSIKNTNPSSVDAVNGSDSMSDHHDSSGPGGFGSGSYGSRVGGMNDSNGNGPGISGNRGSGD